MVQDSERKKILIVSDASDTRIFLCNLLHAVRMDPIGAENRSTGLKMAKTHSPDLIILDLMMADKEGIKFYYTLKNDHRFIHIPVIMLSAIDRATFFLYEKFQSSPFAKGVPEPEGYLEKPPEAGELLLLIDALLKTDSARPAYAQSRKTLEEPSRLDRPTDATEGGRGQE